jgi:subtilisin-like proprotein convertase family protein
MLLTAISISNLNAQCTNASPYGTGTLTATTGSTATIFCNYAEEYGTWNGIVAGLTYTTTSTVGTDFITVRSGSAAGPVVAFGTQPLTWVAAVGGVHYIHVNTNAACGTAATCRDINTTNNGIPVPAVPTQDPTPPTCSAGTTLTVSSIPAANNAYYWQTSATGTSLATPYSGPYTVFANGTYFIRTYSTVSLTWSNAVSVAVSNFPLAPAPPAPVAALDPSCATTGSSLSISTPPVGTEYYWQGATLNGTSTTLNANTPYAYTVSGTYHVSAFETATGCWSVTTPVTVTVDTYVPAAPTVATDNFNICAGATTLEISASTPIASSPSTASSGTISLPIPDSNPTGVTSTLSINNIPAGATITGISVNMSATHTWNSDLDIYLIGANGTQIELSTDNGGSGDNYTNTTFSSGGSALITTGLSPFTGTFLPEGNFTTLYSVANGNWTIKLADDTGGDFGVLQNWSISIFYTIPATTVSWYDASAAGNNIGNASTLETVGTSVLSSPATFGTYQFYAGAVSGACSSTTRTLVTVNVANTNAVLTPVSVTCNGGNNGSFTLGAIECGVEPFEYSLDGGVTFGAIPTDLTAGTYQVIINDANDLQSAPITVVVTQPAAPSNITVAANYFSADVSWTTTGNEASWTIEYGPTGFTPGTGTIGTAVVAPYTLTGLTENTEYDVYVTAVCGAGSQAGGPATFSTNPGFFTFDNACGPGFIDISGTGTPLNTTDDSEAGITLPWSWNINGTTVTSITVGNNGGVLFNTLTGNVAYTATGNGMFPFVQDLNTPIAGGGVYWQNIGTAPNQQFVIMWDNLPHWPSTTGDATFEIIVDQASGEVYFIYDDVLMGNAAYDYGQDAEIAINTPAGNVQVSMNNPTYLQNNSCVHFYNALCPNPTVTSVQTFQEDIILDWAAGAYGETEWTLIWGETGFDPATEGNTESGIVSSDFTISGLTQLTTYDFYIYSECSIDNLTSGGLLVTATTLPWCNTPTALAGVTEVDSLFATWNWTAVADAPNALSSFNIQYGDFGFDLYNGTSEVATGLDNADTVTNVDFLAGGVYQIYVQAVCGSDTSNYAGPYTFVMPLSNDTVCGAEMLSVDGTVYYFNNTGATASLGENGIIPPGSNPDGYNNTILPQLTWGVPIAEGSTWFTFEAPASGSMWFSGNDENFFASQIAIYEATDCSDFTTFELVAASDQVNEDISSKIAPNFTVCGLTPGQTYYVMHEAWSNGFGGLPIFGQYSIKMTPIVLEAGSFVDVLDVCSGSSVDLFEGITGNDAGGIWTAEIPAAGTGIDGNDFSSAGLAYQVFDFEYRVTEGCAYDSIVSQVEIWAPSSAGDDGTIDVCRNEPFDLLSGLGGNVDMGGTWYNPTNQVMPSSATTASNIPGQFNYNYITGNGVCPNDTALVLVNVSSSCNYLDVEEMFFGDMTVFPNPSIGVFNIANEGSTEIFSYEVTDIEGRIIATKVAAINGTSTTEIDLTGKVTGVYMIRVYNDNAEKVFRVVLQ